jgi:hypothetical protein
MGEIDMARSQNGWQVVFNTPEARKRLDTAPLLRNITVPNGVLAGDVAVIFRWLAEQYDRRVERLIPGWCWGWFVKVIEGSEVISNHASGTAVDFNAPANPMGTGTTKRSLTAEQIDECHAIEEESGGVLRWGGDFSRNDPMHWEIVKSPAEAKIFAAKIKREQADMADSDWRKDDINPDPNVSTSAGGAAWTVLNRTSVLNTLPGQIAGLQRSLAEAVADDADDMDALSATLIAMDAKLNTILALLTAAPTGEQVGT